MANVSDYLNFHFSTCESTGAPPMNNGHLFDAVVQVEWDCADPYSNDIMENDILLYNNNICMQQSAHSKQNLTWVPKVRELALEHLQWSPDTTLYINLDKVMDGIVSCYITKQHHSNNLFHLLVDNYIKRMQHSPRMDHIYTTPYNCLHNDNRNNKQVYTIDSI